MSDEPDQSRLDALMCFNVYALHHAFGRFYQAAFADTGFTYPKFIVLLALRESGPMSLGDLSTKIGVEANSLSPLVKKMSAFGLIERMRDPEDERRVLLSLEPYGAAVVTEAQRVVEAGWAELGLSDDVVNGMNANLADVRRRLEKTPPKTVLELPERDPDEA